MVRRRVYSLRFRVVELWSRFAPAVGADAGYVMPWNRRLAVKRVMAREGMEGGLCSRWSS